jgi:hypothetical protein
MVVRFAADIPGNDNVKWDAFLSLETSHPYGVLPAGNQMLMNAYRDKARNPNQTFFRQLGGDEIWLRILVFCDGVSLAAAVQTCRSLYVLGHQPELWRDLVLRKLHLERSNITVATVGDSWKDSFVLLHNNGTLNFPHKPMKVPGIYSDDLYRLHSVRAFAIPPSWLRKTAGNKNSQLWRSKGLVPCINAEDMTSEEFVKDFESPNQPVVIKGAAESWRAFKEWKDPDYLTQHASGRTFRATSGAAPLPANFTLEAFQRYCSRPLLEEAPLYLFDREALTPGSPLHQDYYSDLQRTCPYFNPGRSLESQDEVGHDLFQVLGEGKRPDHTWLITGGSHSGSVFHIGKPGGR